MENPDEPGNGGSKDGNPMEKEADWKEVPTSAERRNLRSLSSSNPNRVQYDHNLTVPH